MPQALGARPIATAGTRQGGVGVERAIAPDARGNARADASRSRLPPRVRSARNTILVEFTGTASPANAKAVMPALVKLPVAAKAPAASTTPAKAAAPAAEMRAAATQLRSVRYAKTDTGYSVTLAGNGALVASKVEEARDLPARVLLDFNDVAAGSAPAVTNVKNDDIDRIRVATNSRDPLITRVVIDLARKLPFTVEQIGDELRVLFNNVIASAADVTGVAAAPAIEVSDEKPVIVNETTALWQMSHRFAPPIVPAPARWWRRCCTPSHPSHPLRRHLGVCPHPRQRSHPSPPR